MLMQALRIKHGLTLLGHRAFDRGSVPGEFAISSFTQTASTARALEIALQTLATLKQHGVSDAAIESARSYILGQYPLDFETAPIGPARWPTWICTDLPHSYIDDFDTAAAARRRAQPRQVVDTAFPALTMSISC